MLRTIAVVLALPLVLAGCGGGDRPGPSAKSATPSITTSTPSSSAPSPTASSPTSVPPNTGDRALKVGDWREGLDIRTRVRSLTQPSDIHLPSYLVGESDAEGAIADVEMCVRKKSTYVLKGSLYDQFRVYDKSGGQYSQASSSWDEWPPRPQFPDDEIHLTAGRCVRGWILFSVPKNVRIRSIANDGQGEATAEWNVS